MSSPWGLVLRFWKKFKKTTVAPLPFMEALESRELLTATVVESEGIAFAAASAVAASTFPTYTSTRAEVYYDQDPHLLHFWGNVHTDVSYPYGGLVQFIDEDTGVVLANGQLIGGEARATAGGLATRLYHVYAKFVGDNIFASSRGQTVEVAVGKSASVTRLSDPHLITIDQPAVQYEVMVGSYSPADKPTLTVYDGDSLFKAVDLERHPSGPFLGTFDTSGLGVGTHTLRAVFAGDAWNFPSEATVIQVIKPVPVATTISLESSTPSIVNPQKFTLTARVTAADGSTVDNGEVRFTDGQLVNQISPIHDGVALLEVGGWLASGAHSFLATYDGSALLDYAGGGPGEVIVQVTKGATSLSVSAPATVQLDPTTHRVRISARVFDADGNKISGGLININPSVDGVLLGQQGAWNDPALFDIPIFSGRNGFLATYEENEAMLASSTIFEVMVTKATTSVHVAAVGGLSPMISASMPAIVKKHPFLPDEYFYPTGTMVFMDGETVLAELPVQGSGAVFYLPQWTDGEHVLTAHYSGDDDYEPAVSEAYQFNYHRVDVQVQVSKRTSPNQLILLTGKVTLKQTGEPLTGISQGLVTFMTPTAQDLANMRVMYLDGGGWIYGRWITDAYLDENGVASRSVDALPEGTRQVLAVFSGITKVVESYPNAGFNTGRGLAFGYESQIGESVSVPETTGLKLQRWFEATPTHSPTFTATVVNAAGQAYRTMPWPADSGKVHSSSARLAIHVPKPQPFSLPVHTSGSNSTGSVVTCAFCHHGITTAPPVPTGTVRFMEGEVQLGEVAVDATGTAAFRPGKLSLGQHTIVAIYEGDSSYDASISEVIHYVVSKTQTATNVWASSNKIRQGESVTLTGRVTTAADSVWAAGWIVLKDGKRRLARLKLGSKLKVIDLDLSVGVHSITAIYEGDKNCAASESSVFKLRVVKIGR